MKLSLSAATLVAVASVFGAADSLTVPNPFAKSGNGQQILNFESAADKIAEKFSGINANNVLTSIASVLNQPLEAVSTETKKIWADMMLEFPETVSKLNFKAPAKKSSSKSQFDYHVSDAKLA